jgi:hypothetical protein
MRVILVALFAAFATLFAFWYFNNSEAWPWWLRAVVLITVVVFLIMAIMLVIRTWFQDVQPWVDQHYTSRQHANAITPESVLVSEIKQLQQWQVEYFMRKGVTLVNVPGLTGPEEYYEFVVTRGPQIGRGVWRIPAKFVEEYMTRADETGLDAIRNYSGEKQKLAGHITDYFVWELHLANEAKGPYSARWTVSLEQAYQWIGWSVNDEQT